MPTYSLDIIIKAIDQASANLKTVGGSLGTLGQEASNAAQSLQPLGLGLAALSATGGALIGTAAMTAARVQVLGTVLETVGGNAGYSKEELAAFEAGLMETGITAGASRQGLIQMAQAEIDLSHATDLARLAQDAAVIANLNSSEAYERLITGIQRGEIELLKTMGLTVDFAGAYKIMAAQLGKTTQELTASEKMQARLNETMKAGEGISGVYINAMDDVGKKMGSIKGDVQDAANALGQAYLPAMGKAVDATRDALAWFTELDAGTQKNIATFLGLGTAVTGAGGALILATPKIITMVGTLSTLVTMTSNVGAGFSLFTSGASMAQVASLGLAGAIGGVVLPLTLFAAAMAGVIWAAQQIPESMKRSTESIIGMGEASIWFEGVGADLQAGMEATTVSAEAYELGMTNLLHETHRLNAGQRKLTGSVADVDVQLGETATEVVTYASEMSMLTEALEGPVSKANEDYTAQQVRISHELIEARKRLKELGAQHGNYDGEIAETEATLVSLEGELVSLDAQHRAVMNQIVYDMMMARLATEGWTSAETELALETARAMGIIDEETWAAATNMNAALDSFAEGESVDNTINSILGIGEEISGLGPVASEAGTGIGAGISSGAAEGVEAIDKVTAAIMGVPKTIDIVTNYSSTGVPPWHAASGEVGYQHGTDYVPRTGWAYLHKGEAVLPAQVAAQYRAGDTNFNISANYAYQSERSLCDDIRIMQLLSVQ